jgi:broad specificity phosphatase PhoE
MKFYFIRHAHFTKSEYGNRHQTQVYGHHISSYGWQQALELDIKLNKSGIKFDNLFCSSLIRTQETMMPFALRKGLKIQTKEGLREIEIYNFDIWRENNGFENSEFKNTPQEESTKEGFERFSKAMDEIVQVVDKDSHNLICAHACIMRIFFDLTKLQQNMNIDYVDIFSCEYLNGKYCNFKVELDLTPTDWQIKDKVAKPKLKYPKITLENEG